MHWVTTSMIYSLSSKGENKSHGQLCFLKVMRLVVLSR